MLEFAFNTRLGSFHLEIECRFASEWTVIFGPSGAKAKQRCCVCWPELEFSESVRQQLARVTLDGRALTDSATGLKLKPARRQTSMVAQQSALFPASHGRGQHRLRHHIP